RTVWPGQHLDCGICGRPLVYGGHGQKDHLVCRGALEYRCWNGVTADGPLAAHKLIAAIRSGIAALPDFDPVLLQLVQEGLRDGQGAQERQQRELARQQAANEREIANVLAAIREVGHSASLLEELSRLEKQKKLFAWELEQAGRRPTAPVQVPT